jgi:SAM-dependent methyltransferase
MAYYDAIAQNWHRATGYKGGSFKQHVLNDLLLAEMGEVTGRAILELGAGNGYFLHLVAQRFSGRMPARIVITDISAQLLAIAETEFPLPGAEFQQLDVRAPYPFATDSFDLILATMVFNEVSTGGLKRALKECRRVLRPGGLLLITVTHPDFIAGLQRRDQLRSDSKGVLTMPGSGSMRLPIVPRRMKDYARLLHTAGFTWAATDVYAGEPVRRDKPGLRHTGDIPLALLLACRLTE